MLLKLHPTVCHQLEAGGDRRDRAIDALEMIAQARREGQHLVFARRETCRRLATDAGLSVRARGLYEMLSNEVGEMKGLVERVSRDVSIIGRDMGGFRSISSGDSVTIQMPLDMLSTRVIQPTVLLCEHFEDCIFYEILARVYAIQNNLGSVAIQFEQQSGGGSTTFRHYRAIQGDRDRFCLCIADSDRLSPGGPLRSTASLIQGEENPDQPLTEIYILGVREVENLLPMNVLSQLSRGDPDRMPSVNSLEALDDSDAHICRMFVDMKNGSTLGDFLGLDQGGPDYPFWEEASPRVLAAGIGCDQVRFLV